MNNRASRLAVVLLAGLLSVSGLLLLNGCERTAATGSGATVSTEDQNAAALAQLAQSAKENNQSLKQLVDSLAEQKALQAQQAGEPPLVRDLAAARFYISFAQKAAEAKNATDLTTALAPLKRVLAAMAAETPGRLIAQHLDRAAYIIRNQQAVGSRELTAASTELSAASEASVNSRPAGVVPDVLGDLKSAKAAVGKGDAAAALQALQSALESIGTDAVAGTLDDALASARAAESAAARKAWSVAAAELAWLDALLGELSKTLSPQTATAATTEKPAATTEQPAASGTATSAVPGATQSTAPPAAQPTVQPQPAAQPTPQAPAATPQAQPTAPATR